MRICHVITKPELGGAQLCVLNILSGLPKDKYDITIITSKDGILKPDFAAMRGVSSFFSPFLKRAINPIADILALIHIYDIYRIHRYDIVHTHSSKAGIIGRWAAKLAGIPCIIHTAHGWSFNDYQPMPVRRFFIFLERLTARFTKKIICVSKNDIESALKYKITTPDKLILIKYGIKLNEFRQIKADIAKKKQELGVMNNDPIIAMISCLKPQKSPIDYVKSAVKIHKRNPNVNFLLIGDGILKSRCVKTLAHTNLNGRFIFTGWRRDVSEIMDIVDIVVLTSRWEGMPIAVIEALSKGKPVVATDAGGTREIIKNGLTGFLEAPGDCEGISERVLRLLADKGLFDRMKKQAFLSIDDSFQSDRMIREIEDVYKESVI